MSADANVSIGVDDSAIDASLAKIEGAVAGSAGGVAGLDVEVDAVERKAQDLISNEGVEIKGLERAVKSILSNSPGLKEAFQLHRGLKNLSVGNIMGAIGLFTLAISILTKVNQYLSEVEQQKRESEVYVRDLRNLNAQEYRSWQQQNTNDFKTTR